LVPPDARIATRTRNMGADLMRYNLFYDHFKAKRVCDRKRIASYIMLTTIGRGSFGKVKLAISCRTKLFFAVKVIPKVILRKQMRSAGHGGAGGAGLKAAGGDINSLGDLREIAIMKKLNHPNVLRIEGVFDDEENDRLYIVVEYMAKGVVMNSNRLEGETPLGLERARRVFLDAMSALEYLHSNRIVHRDIKPDNLLAKADGSVKISDFGTAKLYDFDDSDDEAASMLRSHKTACGTPAFTAPELCMSDAAPDGPTESYPADIWSLGISLFYMVYGRVPFMASNVFRMYAAVCERELAFPPDVAVPDSFKDIVRVLLQKDPYQRATFSQLWRHPWIQEGLARMPPEKRARYGPLRKDESKLRIDFSATADIVKSKLVS